MTKPDPRAITPRQARFVEEYLVDFNGTQAAIRAGYSARTANEQACKMLAKPNIRAAVETKKAVITEKIGVTVEAIVAGLLTEATRTGDDSSPSARVQAWGLLGKYQGMFVDKQQQLGANGQPVDPARPVLNIIMAAPIAAIERDEETP